MLETWTIPRADFLSHTRAGTPWLDFEWLVQLLYYVVHTAAGVGGLLALRVLALAGVLAGIWRLTGLLGAGAAGRGLACAWAGIALFPVADLRPDNFSLLLFVWLWTALEAARQRRSVSKRAIAFATVFFALWANIHPGFAYGLALMAVYAAAVPGLRAAWLAAAVATCLNPHGPALYGVLWRHAADLAGLVEIICEWKPPDVTDPRQRPHLLLAVLALSALLRDRFKTRSAPLPLVIACAGFTLACALHLRHLSYATVAALAALAAALPRVRAAGAWKTTALLAAFVHASFIVWPLLPPVHGGPWRAEPARPIADFLEAHASVLSGKRLYNSWGDGGYLGYRLYPRYPVFQDGRYLFHGLLAQSVAAAKSAGGWRAFMDRHGVEIACLKRSRLGWTMEIRRSPEGRRVAVRVPYWRRYMPEREWALLWWNERDMIFARRSAVPAAWIAQLEYKSLLPDHEPSAEQRASLGLEPYQRLRREVERQLLERKGP